MQSKHTMPSGCAHRDAVSETSTSRLTPAHLAGEAVHDAALAGWKVPLHPCRQSACCIIGPRRLGQNLPQICGIRSDYQICAAL